MGPALQCKFFGHIISIDKALAIRGAAEPASRDSLRFECVKCGKRVGPRIAGDKHVAHFVHLRENPECSFVDPPRGY